MGRTVQNQDQNHVCDGLLSYTLKATGYSTVWVDFSVLYLTLGK